MIRMPIEEAEGRLGHLIEEAAAGEEVLITASGGATVRLVLVGDEVEARQSPSERIGTALDRFIGTWSQEQEAELLAAVEVFEGIDESFWK